MKKSMLHRILRLFTVTICLCIALIACSDNEATPESTVAPSAATTAATVTSSAQPESPLNAPGDSPLFTSPLPTPAAITETSEAETVNVIPAAGPLVDPQTTETTGAATGRIFVHNSQGFRPVTNIIVALALVITGNDGVERAAGYDAATAPRTDIRDDGTFVIEAVPPGRYGVILDSVVTQIMLKEPENLENSLVITVEAGKVTDLQNLVYADLPLSAPSQ